MYTGYREVQVSEAYELYQHPEDNILGLLTNEYLIVKDEDNNVVDIKKWDGYGYCGIDSSGVGNNFIGKIKARNLEQKLAIDMLRDPKSKIKVITSQPGCGKDFLMTNYALHLLDRGKFDKIMWIRNNIEVKNTNSLGYLPGSQDDKLKPYVMLLADHLGGEEGLERMTEMGQLEITHLGFLRGRSIRNSIIYCSEAQNLTREHMKLLISRVDEGSELWINGDMRQTDMKVFDADNGLEAIIDRLKGNELFGYIQLKKIERSAVAQLAELLD